MMTIGAREHFSIIGRDTGKDRDYFSVVLFFILTNQGFVPSFWSNKFPIIIAVILENGGFFSPLEVIPTFPLKESAEKYQSEKSSP